jgi:chromosome segregation DNA-binding protein
MDLNALRRMARKQRETEEAEDNIAPEATVKRVVPAEEPTADTEIYVPLEDDVVDPLPLPDDGYSVSSSVAEDEPKEEMAEERYGETLDEIIQKCFTDEKAYNIELERLLPFRRPIFTNAGDLTDLKSDISRIGITEPLLVRSAGNGEYEILSGNRRRAAAEQLMWTKVPCRIGSNDLITDEYSERIVVESNRSRYSTLLLSEQIRTAAVLGDKAESELHLSHEQAQKYAHLNALKQDFLVMLDNGVINIAAAEMLADLSTDVQGAIINVLAQHPEMKLTGTNIKELHGESNLTPAVITKILKPKPPIKIAIPAEIVAEFMEGKTAEELTEIVSAAIRRYFTEEHDVKI